MFTKQDLKNGDVVVYRNGAARLVIEDRLFGVDSGNYLGAYNDDLTTCCCEEFDIVKVYRGNTISFADYKQKKLVYDREKEERLSTKEMTLEEICKELGYNVKIVKKINNRKV